MKSWGQAIGIGLAGTVGAVIAAAILATAGAGRMDAALWTSAGFFAVSAPLGWLLGLRYDRLKEWADRDALTGVCTRRFLQMGYPRLVHQADRRRKRFTVLLIDVNDFKAINDSLGHARGDDLLRQLAGGLKGAAGHGEIVGRWGGDEFVLFCPYGDTASLDKLNRAIDERIGQVSSQWHRPLSVSIGSAVYPDDGRLLDELVQAADRRMYADKKRHKEPAAHRLNA